MIELKEKVILDSNILIYAVDIESNFYNTSRELILESDSRFLYTTQSNLLEFYRVVTANAFRGKNSFSKIQEVFDFYKTKIKILFPTKKTMPILSEFITEYKPVSGQVWDFFILAQALENEIGFIYTKNIKHFPKTELVKIVDPF